MNKEEILKIVEELKESVRYKTIIPNEERKEWKREYDALQGLLDLYYKQQKEIEELRKKNEPQPDCAESVERTEEMVNMIWVNHNYISKDKIKELKEIDNIDLIHFKIKELLGE